MKLLVLCTGNACRSQMAEGWIRHLLGERIEVLSAGVATHGLDPRAVAVMAEVGVDISDHRSKHVDELADIAFDAVLTVCDNARESCPVFPGQVKRLHASFPDPPRLAANAGNNKDALTHYREVRDQIREYVENALPDDLEE